MDAVKIVKLQGAYVQENGIIRLADGRYIGRLDDITFDEVEQRGSEQMNFGEALQALKTGKKVARAGWNGKGQWVVMMPALYLDASVVNQRTQKHIGTGVDLGSQPYFAIWNAQGKWQPGWVPSVSDCLAEDWQIAE